MRDFFTSWLFWAGLSAVFAALTAVFAKVGVQHIDSDAATFLRTVVVVIGLAAMLTITRKWQPFAQIPLSTYGFLGLSGLGTGASWICYFRALSFGDAAKVASIDKLSIVLIALISVLFLGTRLSALNWLGLTLITTGAILVAMKA